MRQRTQLINALRGHLMEFGIALPQGHGNPSQLVQDAKMAMKKGLPKAMHQLVKTYTKQIVALTKEITNHESALRKETRKNADIKRMLTMPGIGPITALAVEAYCPPIEDFKTGRNFAAWLGLVPLQNSTGGKQKFGRISKMGQRDIRRLLIIGAMSQISAAVKAPDRADPWLLNLLRKKPRLVAGVALANRMARRLWAMLKTGRDYEIQGAAA